MKDDERRKDVPFRMRDTSSLLFVWSASMKCRFTSALDFIEIVHSLRICNLSVDVVADGRKYKNLYHPRDTLDTFLSTLNIISLCKILDYLVPI